MSSQLEVGEENDNAVLLRVWQLCLSMLASKVPEVTFSSYIKPIVPIGREGNIITLGVGSSFSREWLEQRHVNSIRSVLEFHMDTSGLQIKFVVLPQETRPKERPVKDSSQQQLTLEEYEADGREPMPYSQPQKNAPEPNEPRQSSVVPRTPARKSGGRQAKNAELPIPSLPLKERYQFDNFLVGRSNRLAHASAVDVASRPGEVYNPLFLYSGPGLGKTHLLHGIAHELHSHRKDMRVAYVSAEFFTQHYITALRDHMTEDFRRQYREVDVWLVDDVQFIASKEHTKEEFFHTFNTLYQSGRQIVIASDRPPRELNTMDERLRSRFQSGLIVDISPPELETRIAILQQYCQRESFQVPDDVITYIATAIQSNIRALEGAITKLIAYSSIMGQQVDEDMAQSVLGEYFIEKPVRQRKLTADEVIEAVAQQFGITADAIRGPGRSKDTALARHVAMYLVRELIPELKTVLIGTAFGGRDHATIVYACQKMKQLLQVDPDLHQMMDKQMKHLTAPLPTKEQLG